MSDLKQQLLDCAASWCAANAGAPTSRLGKAVVGDANFVSRVAEGGGVNLATLEKFAAFFADAGNWPVGCVIPEAVCGFIHRVEGRMPACCVATGMRERISR